MHLITLQISDLAKMLRLKVISDKDAKAAFKFQHNTTKKAYTWPMIEDNMTK